MDLIAFLVFLGAVYVIGSSIEKNHFHRIIEREKFLLQQPHTTDDFILTPDMHCRQIKLVTGACVIGADYFKMFVAGLRSWFGGPLTTYEGLLDRARREAVLRMREEAAGADMVVQTRICTAEIKPGVVEIQAYGTAIYLAK